MEQYKRVTTSLGECVVVESFDALDANPQVLASRLPVFHADEMATLRGMDAPQRQRAWARRVAACAGEAREREANPKRDSWAGDAELKRACVEEA